jgi:hypothetical protein
MRTVYSLAVVTGLVLSLGGCALINRWSGVSEARRIQEIGVPGEARILAIWDTGMTLNDDPVVGLRVLVDRFDGQPYEVEIAKSVVSRVHLPQFQPGSVVPVKIDPAAPDKVALDVYSF